MKDWAGMSDDWMGIGDPFGRVGMASAHQAAQIHPDNPELDMTDEEKRRRKACPNKPLTRPPLTTLYGSPCKRIEPVSVEWRKEFENKPDSFDEESYTDGYSEGFAAGLNFTSQPKYEDNSHDFEGIKIKPEGIDTDEFRKQCEDIDKGE